MFLNNFFCRNIPARSTDFFLLLLFLVSIEEFTNCSNALRSIGKHLFFSHNNHMNRMVLALLMHTLSFIGLLIILFLLASCTKSIPESSGELSFHFCHLIDCDEVFIDSLTSASSLSCAFYDMDEETISHLLLDRNASVIVDEHDTSEKSFSRRMGDGLMHNKFCIINESVVVTGSYNPTTKNSFDNVVTIESEPIAKHYKEQFSQLLNKQKKPSSHTSFLHDEMLVEVYACPQDDCAKQVYRHLLQANSSIHFLLFTFTDKEITRILIKKHGQGVRITGMVESFQSKAYNQYYPLQDAGIPVFLEETSMLQHNKVFVIDERVVITGSYNPTKAANTINDENIIIFHDSSVARHYAALVEDTIKRTQSFKYGPVLS